MAGKDFDGDLAALAAAFEAGLDLPAVLGAACRAVSTALEAGPAARLHRLRGRRRAGADRRRGPRADGAADRYRARRGRAAAPILPLVSARRVLGCIVVDGEARDGLSRARVVAAVAAQAAEASRLWESAGAGAGTLDLLTGLPNHRGFQTVLARELARAKRTGQSLAVCVLDIDGLSSYNEKHGRPEGDRMLRLAAECFARGVRSYDCVCRLGEDEFALVLPGMAAESAATLVSRLSATFASWAPADQALTVSGGRRQLPPACGHPGRAGAAGRGSPGRRPGRRRRPHLGL